MELVALLRVLWRFRLAVAAGSLVAVALGVVAIRGTTQHLGVASMRVMVDTPRSQTVDVAPNGAETLQWRTELLADLMAYEPFREDIARRMDIDEDALSVSTPYLSVPEVPAPLASAAVDAAAADSPEPYHVEIQAASPLPMIGIDVRAPDRDAAGRLAEAAAAAMSASSTSEAASAPQKYVVDSVGSPKARAISDGPRRVMAPLVALVVAGLWCACIILFDGLRARRRATARSAARLSLVA